MSILQELLALHELHKDSAHSYQVRVGSGDWQDIKLYFDDLEDIKRRVQAIGTNIEAQDVGQLTELVEGYIGEGPDGHGSTWDDMDFEVESLKDDVLKIGYTFSGFNQRHERTVTKTGTITLMPGN